MAHRQQHQQQEPNREADGRLLKRLVTESTAPKRISHIQFGLMAADEVQSMSEFQLSSNLLFKKHSRAPAVNGVLDPRLGVSDKQTDCETCRQKQVDCAGHFGYIRLEMPCFHIGYFKHTLTILQCICKTCATVMVDETSKLAFLKKLRNPRLDALGKNGVFKKVVAKCKKNCKCMNPLCGAYNGTVKKVAGAGSLKLIHEKYKGKNAAECIADLEEDMGDALDKIKDLKTHLSKASEDLSALTVLDLFRRISDEDCELLWMNANVGRPENLIIQNLLVPPVPIRPSVAMDIGGGSTEDDLTATLQEIIGLNICLRSELTMGANMKLIMEHYDLLQMSVSMYINGEIPGLVKPVSYNRPIRGLCQRLKGKSGRFRGNLSGKRVDFSARTVISPDPNLRVDQVGVPEHVAKVMTYPERVTSHNRDKLIKCIQNGHDVHPGANYVRPRGEHAIAKRVVGHNKKLLVSNLQIGDIVERHMEDGDVVLFNRQPSLHKMSIMAHRAKIMPWRTFRFNECVCSPYNADFDGDEMNMHLPQTEEARAEAGDLMAVVNNLVTPRNGEPLVAATQDFLTASYLITQREIFFDREGFSEVVSYLGDAGEQIDIPMPAIVYPVALWTGKQVMSLLVRPNRQSQVLVNFEMAERMYDKNKNFCKNDGYVHFRNSEMVSGTLAKKTLGDGSKTGLFYTLIREHGPAEAARCMNRLAKVCARYLGGQRGFSIGIDDVTPSTDLSRQKLSLLQVGYDKADLEINEYRKGQLTLRAGCDAIQSLESSLNGVLGELRQKAGDIAMKELPWVNSPRIMADCGSKGSTINISQMIACVGQQSVGGKRIENGFVCRTLPHFPSDSLFPAAKGFVANSFYSGLTATEFFFHTMGGREGLVDTAVKTAETGYMARRLMKALEDLSMQYDSTVRNSEQTVVQFAYGDDGLNPQCMETTIKVNMDKQPKPVDVGRPVEFGKLLTHIMAITPCEGEPALEPDEIDKLAEDTLLSPPYQAILPTGIMLHHEVSKFFGDIADRRAALASSLDIPRERKFKRKYPSSSSNDDNDNSSNDTSNDNSMSVSPPPSPSPIATLAAAAVAARAAATPAAPAVGSLEWRRTAGLGTGGAQSAAFKQWERAAQQSGSPAAAAAAELLLNNTARLTAAQGQRMLAETLTKYLRARVEPGEAVGAIGAQSISEPGTQMTLKTFHFAGVASMNVTLGVPRLKEIINASKQISTPIIEAILVKNNSKAGARLVKATIEKTTLGQVTEYIKEVYANNQCYIAIKLDLKAITQLNLDIDSNKVRHCILKGNFGETRPPVLRLLKDSDVQMKQGQPDKLIVIPPEPKSKGVSAAQAQRYGGNTGHRAKAYFVLQALKKVLPGVIVQGIPSISRAVICHEEGVKAGDTPKYKLCVEGYGLAAVMGAAGIDGTRTWSNHIVEVEKTLGIEAARNMITQEISYIMSAYGISVDRRHLLLLSDVMSFKGEILGITRFGVSKMRESVLMLASFEKTTDHLFDAAVHGRSDAIIGVSECIIMGIPIPLGTGLFKLLRADTPNAPPLPSSSIYGNGSAQQQQQQQHHSNGHRSNGTARAAAASAGRHKAAKLAASSSLAALSAGQQARAKTDAVRGDASAKQPLICYSDTDGVQDAMVL